MNYQFKGLIAGLIIFGSIAFFMEDQPTSDGSEYRTSSIAMVSHKLKARNERWQAQLDYSVTGE